MTSVLSDAVFGAIASIMMLTRKIYESANEPGTEISGEGS